MRVIRSYTLASKRCSHIPSSSYLPAIYKLLAEAADTAYVPVVWLNKGAPTLSLAWCRCIQARIASMWLSEDCAHKRAQQCSTPLRPMVLHALRNPQGQQPIRRTILGDARYAGLLSDLRAAKQSLEELKRESCHPDVSAAAELKIEELRESLRRYKVELLRTKDSTVMQSCAVALPSRSALPTKTRRRSLSNRHREESLCRSMTERRLPWASQPWTWTCKSVACLGS